MKSLRQILIIVGSTLVLLVDAYAQQVITEDDIVDRALRVSAAFQSSELQVRQSRQLQKTGFNLPNPEVIAESPTGEFYAIGVLQSMEFPTVYIGQSQLRKQVTKLSETQRDISSVNVKYAIRSLYLNLQFAETRYTQLKRQDSLYNEIATSATRQFDAGTIDYLAKTFSLSQAGEIHNQLISARYDLEAIHNQLRILTGIAGEFSTTALVSSVVDLSDLADSTAILSNPTIQYYRQLQNVNRKTLSVERQKALPGLVVGYLNQGPRDTDTFYRFRVGVTVPLWFWQYAGNVKAAKIGVQIAEQDSKAQSQSISVQLQQTISDYRKYTEALRYYETTGLTQSDDIIKTAKRFFESGQTDYTTYLRNLNEGYLIKSRYLETLRNHNQSIITINYLTGKL